MKKDFESVEKSNIHDVTVATEEHDDKIQNLKDILDN